MKAFERYHAYMAKEGERLDSLSRKQANLPRTKADAYLELHALEMRQDAIRKLDLALDNQTCLDSLEEQTQYWKF